MYKYVGGAAGRWWRVQVPYYQQSYAEEICLVKFGSARQSDWVDNWAISNICWRSVCPFGAGRRVLPLELPAVAMERGWCRASDTAPRVPDCQQSMAMMNT